MEVRRAYRFRFYPTPEQTSLLGRTFGCARFIYNWALDLRSAAWRDKQRRIPYAELDRRLTNLKHDGEHDWLNEVSAVPLQQALRHLDIAFVNFFEHRARYPRFHRKHNRQSATFTRAAFRWDGERLLLAKMDEPLDVRWTGRSKARGGGPHRFTGEPSSVTVSRDPAGRWFVSFSVEEEVAPLPLADGVTGIDLGLASLATFDDGTKVAPPRFYRRERRHLARAQRALCRKRKGSHNREKARRRVARIHARIADRRRDFLHQLSWRIVRENQTVCAETLTVKNLLRNHHLSLSISDAGWGTFNRLLAYKCDWYGREFVSLDPWLATSKTCSECGHVLDALPLEIRWWVCPKCGSEHDRDVNAARNIRASGLMSLAAGPAV